MAKARQNLEAADAELQAGRNDVSASRSYYAAFHAAIAALLGAGIRPMGRGSPRWKHDFVRSRFEGLLVHRQHRYGPEFRQALSELSGLRLHADYDPTSVRTRDAARALRLPRALVGAVEQGMRGENRP